MPKAKIYNIEGQIVGERELPADIFDVALNENLVHTAVVAQMANARKIFAHTKDRGEVAGGGRKPWKQKHTGRARHGSIRSPLWVGGGITFGPNENRNYSQKMNRQARRKAFLTVLSDKVRDNRLILLETLELKETKTKLLAAIIKKLPVNGKTLLVIPKDDKTVLIAAKNLPDVFVARPESMNVVETLRARYLVLPIPALETVEKLYRSKP